MKVRSFYGWPALDPDSIYIYILLLYIVLWYEMRLMIFLMALPCVHLCFELKWLGITSSSAARLAFRMGFRSFIWKAIACPWTGMNPTRPIPVILLMMMFSIRLLVIYERLFLRGKSNFVSHSLGKFAKNADFILWMKEIDSWSPVPPSYTDLFRPFLINAVPFFLEKMLYELWYRISNKMFHSFVYRISKLISKTFTLQILITTSLKLNVQCSFWDCLIMIVNKLYI